MTLHATSDAVLIVVGAVKSCIALRGTPYEYDEWGLPEWTWERCLPAFRRMENDLDVRSSNTHLVTDGGL